MFGSHRRSRALAPLALACATLGATAGGAHAEQVTTFKNFLSPGEIVDLAADESGLYAASQAGPILNGSRITSFTYEGTVRWSVALSLSSTGADVADIVPAPDGGVWFTLTDGSNVLGHVGTNRQVSLTPIAGIDAIEALASTPDERVFIVADGELGELSGDGETVSPITEIDGIVDLEGAPDGSIWFVGGTSAGSVRTDGTVTSYTLPAPADSVVADGAGHAWFGAPGEILRLKIATGAVTRFAGPEAERGVAVDHLATATDGSVWFSSTLLDSYGWIDEEGTISTWSLGDAVGSDTFPTSMVAGADGELWLGSRAYIGNDLDPLQTVLQRVKTQGAPTAATPEPTVTVDGTSARVRLRINPQGGYTSAVVQYDTAQPLRSQTIPFELGSYRQFLDYDETIHGLLPGRTYIVVVKAVNPHGTWTSSEVRFAIAADATAPKTKGSLGSNPGLGGGVTTTATGLKPLLSIVKLSRGVIRVPLRCATGTCKATVAVSTKIGKKRGVVIASKAVNIAPGKSKVLGLRLSKAGVKAVKKASARKGLGTLISITVDGKTTRYRLAIRR